MSIPLKPKASQNVAYTIPTHIRETYPVFVEFIETYYRWAEQKGMPLELLQNISDYNDIDSTTDEFANHMIKSFAQVIPNNIQLDKRTLVKNIKSFVQSKGTDESFKFVLNAIYGLECEIDWMRDYVFRSSSNCPSNSCTIAIAGEEFIDVAGCVIEQTGQINARATIESSLTTVVNSKHVNVMYLNPNSLGGEFIAGANVKILKSNVNRSFYEVSQYYQISSYSDVFNADGSATSYVFIKVPSGYVSLVGLNIGQVSTDISGIVISDEMSDTNVMKLVIKNKKGNWNNSEVYFLPDALVNFHYTKADYYYGVVSPIIGAVKFNDRGAMYKQNMKIDLIGGSGSNAALSVKSVTSGEIDSTIIFNRGSGYVKDQIIVSDEGKDFSAVVTGVDGIDAQTRVVMEVESISSSNYTNLLNTSPMGTSIYSQIPIVKSGDKPATIKYTGINTYEFLDRGEYTICPPCWWVTPTSLQTLPSGQGFASINISYRLKRVETSLNGLGFVPEYKSTSGVVSNVTGSGPWLATCTVSTTVGLTVGAKLSITSGVGSFGSGDIVVASVPTATTFTFTSTSTSPIAGSVTGISAITYTTTLSGGHGSGATFDIKTAIGCVTGLGAAPGGSGYAQAVPYIESATGSGFIGICNIVGGSITSVTIIDSGQGYSNGDLLKISGTSSNGTINDTASSLAITVSSVPQIKSCFVITQGYGYHPATRINVYSNGVYAGQLLPTITNGAINSVTVPAGIQVPGTLTWGFNISDVSATISIPVDNTGTIQKITPINCGKGHNPVGPLKITYPTGSDIVNGIKTGTGAIFIPVIQNGVIIRVNILQSGSGYLPGTYTNMVISGGGGTGASISGTVNLDGLWSTITVVNGGNNYKYGVGVYITGDGYNASAYASVETGVTSVEIVNGGKGYTASTKLSLGNAVFGLILDSTGKITKVNVIDRGTSMTMTSGSSYLTPTITNAGSGSGAIIRVYASYPIKSMTIDAPGTGYTAASAFILTDGYGASATVQVARDGSLVSTATLSGTTTGLSSAPEVNISNVTNAGKLTSLKIINGGTSFSKPSSLKVSTDILNSDFKNTSGYGARIVGYGANVGGIRELKSENYGAEYYDTPIISCPTNVIMTSVTNFIIGERVSITSDLYKDPSESMIITDIDVNVNTMTFNNSPVDILFVDENGAYLVMENDLKIVHELHTKIEPGCVITGLTSGATGSILKVFRAESSISSMSIGISQNSLPSAVGVLNDSRSKLNENLINHDFAYKIKTGASQDKYRQFITDLVHPAGYKMFGHVNHYCNQKSNVTVKLIDNGEDVAKNDVTINIPNVSMPPMSIVDKKSLSWINANKFRISGCDYGYLQIEGTFDSLVCEQTDANGLSLMLVGNGLYTQYSGPSMDTFADLTIESFENTTNTSSYNIDFGCEVDIT